MPCSWQLHGPGENEQELMKDMLRQKRKLTRATSSGCAWIADQVRRSVPGHNFDINLISLLYVLGVVVFHGTRRNTLLENTRCVN